MKSIVVIVTAKDIAKGLRRSANLCPIALALDRRTKGYCVAEHCFCSINGKDFSLPPSARLFIRDFDAGNPVKPFRFTINVGASK